MLIKYAIKHAETIIEFCHNQIDLITSSSGVKFYQAFKKRIKGKYY